MNRGDRTDGERVTRVQRAAAELALMAAIGVFMGAIGPYDTDGLPLLPRYVYWAICMVGGMLIGIAIDESLGRRFAPLWQRLAFTSVAMTPFVTLLVEVTGHLIGHQPLTVDHWLANLWNVFIISLPVMTVRAWAWRKPMAVIETRTIIEAPLPEAEAAFRRRLSAKRRAAALLAVEAYDHYLRVHTDAGTELITMRFADAMAELAAAHGFQTHRSWWVAADAIDTVRWRRGGGEALLKDGTAAPVSRTYAPALKQAGWS